MPAKLKPKTAQQIEEVIKLFEQKSSTVLCDCLECQMSLALYKCSVAALSWSKGNAPKNFSDMISALKSARSTKDQAQCSHAE